MKKLVAVMLLMSGIAYADIPGGVNRSSFTQTSDSGKCIPTAKYLDKVIVGVTSSNGVLTLYNSTWTTTSIISSMSLTAGTVDFNNLAVKGICYTTVTNTNGFTIIYKQ